MGCLEIVELTGERHDRVRTDITTMLEELDFNAPEFSGTLKSDQGNTCQCFNLSWNLTGTLITAYGPPPRAKIIDR